MANTTWDNIRNYFTGHRNAVAEIITVNVAVFALKILLQILLSYSQESKKLFEDIVFHLSLPASLHTLLYQPYSIITFMFMHDGFWHIVFNMLGIYIFGEIIRDYIGNHRVWPLYILGSMAGAVAYLFILNIVPYWHALSPLIYALGASAGVMALVFAAATLLPNNQIYLMIIGGVPLKFVALFYFLADMSSIALGDNFGGHIAHIGGAAFGFLFIKQLNTGTDLTKGLGNLLFKMEGLFTAKPKRKGTVVDMKPNFTAGRKTSATSSPINVQERIDQILDKINDKGVQSLTEEERTFLDNFSRK